MNISLLQKPLPLRRKICRKPHRKFLRLYFPSNDKFDGRQYRGTGVLNQSHEQLKMFNNENDTLKDKPLIDMAINKIK